MKVEYFYILSPENPRKTPGKPQIILDTNENIYKIV